MKNMKLGAREYMFTTEPSEGKQKRSHHEGHEVNEEIHESVNERADGGVHSLTTGFLSFKTFVLPS